MANLATILAGQFLVVSGHRSRTFGHGGQSGGWWDEVGDDHILIRFKFVFYHFVAGEKKAGVIMAGSATFILRCLQLDVVGCGVLPGWF